MSSSPPFPPPNPKSVFTVQSTTHIKAPAAAVYALLTNIETWPEWNTFVPSACVLSRPSPNSAVAEERETATGKMEVGMRMRFHVNMTVFGMRMGSHSWERVTLLETPDQQVSSANARGEPAAQTSQAQPRIWRAQWVEDMTPEFLMRCLRINEIEEVRDGSECVYRTCEFFEGPLAWGVRLFAGRGVQEGFDRWAEGLRKAAERAS